MQLSNFTIAVLVGFALTSALAVAHAVLSRRGAARVEPLRRDRWDWFVDSLTWLTVIAMAGTGLGGALVSGRMSGWPLLAHALVGGVFLPALALTAMTWARRCRFDSSGGPGRLAKACFWAMLSLGLLTSASILSAMTPLAGYNAQETLYTIHRYSALGLVLVVLFQTYLALSRRYSAKVQVLCIDGN